MATESHALRGTRAAIQFANGTTIESVAGDGAVTQRIPVSNRLRGIPAERDTSPTFEAAMADLGIREQETIVFDAYNVGTGGSDSLVIRPAPPAAPGQGQVLLYQDESGGLSWHFTNAPRSAAPAGLRDPGLSSAPAFVVPLRSSATRAALRNGMPRQSLRGPITKIGRKIFKVLVLPVVSQLLEKPVEWLYERVESRIKPYRIWQVDPINYTQGPKDNDPAVDWKHLSTGPTLLLIHGIFSSVEGMIARLPRETLQRWHDRYQGRIIAFNHPTASASPEDNARWFLTHAAEALGSQPLKFDIICHSRGGIVSRVLTERPADTRNIAPLLDFRSIYFVASPNAGSALGDADHVLDMLDLFTSFMTSFPDGPVSYSLEIVLALVMLVARAGAKGLPGIAAMATAGGYIENVLNAPRAQPSKALYSAAAATYQPVPGRDNGLLLDKFATPLLDKIFAKDGQAVANDLVVPEAGVYGSNGGASFPIKDPLIFGPADGVWHTAFFSQPRTSEHIEKHLERVNASAPTPALAPSSPPPVGSGPHRPPGGEGSAISEPDPRSATTTHGSGGGAPPPRRGGFRGIDIGASRGVVRDGDRGGFPGGYSETYAPPQPTAPAVPTLPEETISRDPSLDFHERMEEGETSDLTVRLALPDTQGIPQRRLTLTFAVAEPQIDLDVVLTAPGFDIAGKPYARLSLKRVRDESLEQATFKLTALSPGAAPVDRIIKASFWRGNDCVGGLTHSTVVVPKGYEGLTRNSDDSLPRLRVPAQRREAPDLIISVRRITPGQDQFALSMRSVILGEEYESRDFGTFNLNGKELTQYLSQFVDPIFQQFPGAELSDSEFDQALPGWNASFMRNLQDLGKDLWLQLPDAFRKEYERLAGKDALPRSIGIYSDELQFPWELVQPAIVINGQYEELPPLGAQHILGRWQPATAARPQPQARPVRSMAILCPGGSNLPSAAQEATNLATLITTSTPITPVNKDKVDELLRRLDVQIVHFSGHGVLGANADLTELQLDDGSITAPRFAQNALGTIAQPMLFLNACSVGRGGAVLGRSGGFAGLCVAAGWSGVIAPYWPVYDSSAAVFGIKLYQKLMSGCCIGEALQELRREYDKDPTVQSYAYFGDPFARLLFN